MLFIKPEKTTLITQFGFVTYLDQLFNLLECAEYFNYFQSNIHWTSDELVIYGKKIITKRKIAWFANSNFDYNYSGVSRIATSWDEKVLEIKQKLQLETGITFNSCLLNYYPTGKEGMAWHSDDQNHLQPNSTVAIISFGVERFFKLRLLSNKSEPVKILLQKGSLLLMLDETQKYWQHEIPKMAGIIDPRISLTFRSMK